MKEMYIEIHGNENYFKAVGEELVRLGYEWYIGDTYDGADRLVTLSTGIIKRINGRNGTRVTFDDLVKMEPEKKVEELTVAQISEKLGYEVKIVK
jgi:hypothetical protein